MSGPLNAPTPVSARIPPHSIEAEMSVLGSMMLGDAASVDRGAELLTRDDFYRDAHGHLFDAMLALRRRRVPVDVITLKDALQQDGTLAQIGGVAYLLQLGELPFTTANLVYYAGIVRDKAVYRRLILAASEIAGEAFAEGAGIEGGAAAFLARAEGRLFDCGSQRQAATWRGMRAIGPAAIDRLEERRNAGGGLVGISSGLTMVDRLTGGFAPGDLVILAGRPSMGKTACAMSIARHAALAGNVVGFFSAEMDERSVGDRLLSAEAQVALSRIRRGTANEQEWIRLCRANDRLYDAPLFVDDTARSVSELEGRARRLRAEQGGLDLIVVDYLQYLSGTEGKRFASPREEVSDIAHGLKVLAKTLRVPVLVLSQLSRNVERREEKRPMMSDLAESGRIEAEADVIAFLYRASYYAAKEEAALEEEGREGFRDEVEFIVAKSRNDQTGFVRLAFAPHYTRFDNLEARFG